VRISELSRTTGVPVATIKYYLREGLLPAGTPTAPNQAAYSELHVHRLRLVRALMEVGGLGVSAVRRVLEAVDDQRLPLHEVLGVAHRALGPATEGRPVTEEVTEARADVDRFVDGLGWRVSADAPARRALADALLALRRLGREVGPEVFTPYAAFADTLAAREVDYVAEGGSRTDAVERVVVGTVIFEAALVALRRMAQAHHSAVRFSRSRGGRGTRRRR
jgi:DNA-binding transcriptional MerR regulator